VSDLPIVSVVIPAHNESAVLAATLERLLAGTVPGEFDVIVVPNACTDATAAIARAAGVTVIETPVPGKVPALRLGDEACQVFPRIYLDADVLLSAEPCVRWSWRPRVRGAACAPVPSLDLTGVSAWRAVFTACTRRWWRRPARWPGSVSTCSARPATTASSRCRT
jgi:hypothetical protein